jgi:hypothetical protein
MLLSENDFVKCKDNLSAWALRMGERNEARTIRNCYTKFILLMWPLQFRVFSYKMIPGLDLKNVFNSDEDVMLRNMPKHNQRKCFFSSVDMFVSWFLNFMGLDRITDIRCLNPEDDSIQVYTSFLTHEGKSHL